MYPWVVQHITFPLFQKMVGERVLDCLRELEKTQWYSSSQLLDLQWKKLEQLLAHCYDNVSYYRALFDKLAMRPEDIKDMDDFRQLPILTKQEMRQNLHQMVAQDKRRPFTTRKTSGSTGIPVEFQIGRAANSYRLAAQARGRRWWGWDVGDRRAALWGTPFIWGTSGYIPKLRRLKRRLVDNYIDFPVCDLRPQSMRKYYHQMWHFKPRFMYSWTSALYTFARFVKDEGLDGHALGLEGVVLTAEVLYPHQRDLIEAVLGCPVISEYGCGEVAQIALQCPEGSMHLMSENVLVEFLKEGKPAEPGQRSNIIVTDLNNYRMPLVRYSVGDVGCYNTQHCSCGRGLPLMEIAVGREVDLIQLKNGQTLHPEMLSLPHNSILFEKIRQYKITQRSLTHFFIQIEAEPGNESLLTDVFSTFLRERLGEDITVELEFVKHIPSEKSGKVRYFVSEVKAEGELSHESPMDTSNIALE